MRASEIRKRLAELAAIEEMNDEQRSEIGTMRTEYRDVETRYQAALLSEDTPAETRFEDTEGRELRSLIDSADVGAIFAATLEHRQTDGHTAELQQHYGLGANQVPAGPDRNSRRNAGSGPSGSEPKRDYPWRVPDELRGLPRDRYAHGFRSAKRSFRF